MQYNVFATITVLAIIIFLAGGGLAFTHFLLGNQHTTASTPKERALTPIAIFLLIMGTFGVYILILAGQNLQHGCTTLAKKQLVAGFMFIFVCDIGFRLLEGTISSL